MRILVSLITLLGVIACIGCQPNPINAEAPLELNSSPTVTRIPASQTQAMNTPDRIGESMTKTPERVPPTQAITPVTGEVPTKLLDSILQDLSKRTGVNSEKISVTQAQAIIWNDGSLGCPQPGKMYTMALVPGYRVKLEIGGQKYDYHAAESGYFFLCESGLPSIPAPATPNS
jgi:NifB/MoaA-like Fe-S oxidoreductase